MGGLRVILSAGVRQALAGLLAISLTYVTTADAEGLRPSRDRTVIYDWRETSRLEHQDRKRRLERLAAQGLIASPEFYEALIPKKELPQFGVALPVLRVVFPQRVFFDTDKSELRPDAAQTIALVAQELRRDVPDVALFVAGHTDSRGSDEYNYLLSIRRADAVARSLFAEGIGLSRIWRIGFGKAVPVKPNDTAEHMAENRRVEFLFSARAEAVAVWLSKQARSLCDRNYANADECRRRIAALPSFTATPILGDKKDTIVASPEASLSPGMGATQETTKQSVTAKTVAGADDPTTTATIQKNSQVIINLNEQKVTIGGPLL